ncbi:MAG: ankyrin repeat domain-containing protein [Alphaproteobacteria bacterium]|nr:ankyrin repeat domain-containing protein [Alphaproteobacteria bacterium]OJV12510.1 MAG: hypothetical protein BGO27_07240 [Alphaproteobacteria bacterium 33-17]
MAKYFLKLFFLLCFSTYGYAGNKANQLITAIQTNNMAHLSNYLETGLNPDMRGEYGITPIMFAVSSKNIEAVRTLLKYSADVNATDIAGVSPLHIAARNGDNNIVKLLLDNGANINAQDSYHMTPLMKATAANKTATVELLLANGATSASKDKFGYSANKMANKTRNEKIKSMLDKQSVSEPDDIEKAEVPVKSAMPRITAREIKPKNVQVTNTENHDIDNAAEDTITDMPWLSASNTQVSTNGRKITIRSKNARSKVANKMTNKMDMQTAEVPKMPSNLESSAGTTVIKTRTRKITVGKAKLMSDPIKKWQVTEPDLPTSNGNYKIALHVYFEDKNQDFGDLLAKVLRQTQYYKVKYQLVQNVRNNTRYIKISYFNSEKFAGVYCNRILENKLFRACNVVKVSNPRG